VSLARHLYASAEHPTHVYAYQQPFAEHKLSQGQDFAGKAKHFAKHVRLNVQRKLSKNMDFRQLGENYSHNSGENVIKVPEKLFT